MERKGHILMHVMKLSFFFFLASFKWIKGERTETGEYNVLRSADVKNTLPMRF